MEEDRHGQVDTSKIHRKKISSAPPEHGTFSPQRQWLKGADMVLEILFLNTSIVFTLVKPQQTIKSPSANLSAGVEDFKRKFKMAAAVPMDMSTESPHT